MRGQRSYINFEMLRTLDYPVTIFNKLRLHKLNVALAHLFEADLVDDSRDSPLEHDSQIDN